MIIRYAEIADYPWLAENDIYIPNHILEKKIELKEVYVVEQGCQLVGWLRYNLFWDIIPFANMLYFLEDYRGKGFGKEMMLYWENQMREKGFENVMTSTLSSEGAQHFYRKLGYKEIGGFIYLDEPLEILFQKKL